MDRTDSSRPDSSDRPVIETARGLVRGVRGANVETYFGIPYAAPPVGQLRWRPPGDLEPWQGLFDAASFGPDAMQRAVPPSSRAGRISEDCLRLNIWRSRQRSGPRPVMVWIHGGSFVFGSASDVLTDGSDFAEGGALFVSIGSRLGIFGFLAHPELVEESPQHSCGNYGLLDIIAGLRWIRHNIAAFGGDPHNITLFGVSSGSASITMLMTSPLARGLFDRVILQSPGSYRPLASLEAAAGEGAKLGALRKLREASAQDILAMEPRLIPQMRKLTAPRILRPIRDGWVLPHHEREAFETGSFAPVSTLIGSNADEGSLLVAGWPINDLQSWNQVIEENFGAAADEARRHYPALRDEDARAAVANMFGDTQFSLGVRAIARAVMKRQPATYRYLFTHRRAGSPTGPDHGGEVVYVFKSLGKDSGAIEDRDRSLAASMHAAWLRFAATGNPGVVEGVSWISAQDGILELGDVVQIRASWREEQLDFVNAYLTSTRRS
jgi:carboxylesterase type B